MEHLEGERKAAEAKGEPVPEHYHDENVADVIMDFLFASQDASTASLTWIAALMADHPEILAKARGGPTAARLAHYAELRPAECPWRASARPLTFCRRRRCITPRPRRCARSSAG